MNIDISNAHCGPRILFPDHAWLRVRSTNKTRLLFSLSLLYRRDGREERKPERSSLARRRSKRRESAMIDDLENRKVFRSCHTVSSLCDTTPHTHTLLNALKRARGGISSCARCRKRCRRDSRMRDGTSSSSRVPELRRTSGPTYEPRRLSNPGEREREMKTQREGRRERDSVFFEILHDDDDLRAGETTR